MPIVGKIFLAIVISGMIGGICFFSFQNFSPSKENFKPENLEWERAKDPPWQPRDSHSAIVFKDKIFIIGGLNGNGFVESPGFVKYGEAPHFSDVWVSEDGMNWSLLTEKAPWGKRRSIQAVVFKDEIWIVPGWGPLTGTKNEIWSSKDGMNWNLVNQNPGFPPREGHKLIVFKDKIWIVGGVNYEKGEVKNDVWFSEDGVNWFEATENATWPPRWDHEVVAFKGKLWLIGGMDLKGNVFGDVWVSENGKDWNLVTDNPPWPKRQGHEALVFKNRIWILGRLNEKSQGGGKNDIWFSEDGVNWKKTKKDPPWEGREDHAALVFRDKIWIFGGMTVDWVWKNDVWFSK